ncbi:MAG: site-specific integrase, partial [Desulfovibrionaceae bacterium]|nr:site-specific integrase [Desulfovibrionaceae bacterium]
EVTFESAAAEWFATKGKNLSPRYRQEKWRRVEKYLLPHLGAIPFSRLRLLDLIRTHLLLRDTPELCRRVAQLTGQICRFAQVMQYVDSDISAGLVEVLPDKPPIRHRAAILEPAEFAALLKLIDGYRGYAVVRLALMIMANVFCRSSELVGARWEELDFEKDLWTIPAERMKRRRKHLIPLSRQVRELFQCLRSLDSETEYCFPSTLRKNCHITSEALLGALLRMGYTRDEISVHGFRSTASTILNTMKFRPDAIELQLAHVERNSVRAAYNRSDLLEERRQMLQFWSDYLDELRSS